MAEDNNQFRGLAQDSASTLRLEQNLEKALSTARLEQRIQQAIPTQSASGASGTSPAAGAEPKSEKSPTS